MIAATEIFVEHGVSAPLNLITQRARVGRATLYRNFPDRSALALALLAHALDMLEKRAKQLENRDDALFELLRFIAGPIAVETPLFDLWQIVDELSDSVRNEKARLIAVFERPIAAARAAGLCRYDLGASDVVLITTMIVFSARNSSRSEQAGLVARAMDLLEYGLITRP